MDQIRFNCRHCKAALKASANLAGRYMPCPNCQKNTPVPESEDEGGTYDMAASASARGSGPKVRLRRDEGPTDEDWCAPDYDKLHPMWRGALDSARGRARARNWTQALIELRELFQASGGQIVPTNYPVRKPLAYCLVQWTADDLEMLKGGERLSRPIRTLMRMAVELRKWGGTFTMRKCPLCERQDPQRRGCTKVQTAIGWAYLCCAAPTKNDLMLVAAAEILRDRLVLARAFDDRNEAAALGAAVLPEWLRLLIADSDSGRVQEIGSSRGSNDGAGFWDNALGAIVSNAINR